MMWTCLKCGRGFEKNNQDHFCVAISSIDEYINEQPETIRPILSKLRDVIRSAAPDAKEKISWRMPTFWQGENLIHFAAFKKHISVYPGDLSQSPFADRLEGYRHAKGTIQFPLDKPIDYEFVAEITRYRVATVLKEKKLGAAQKKQE